MNEFKYLERISPSLQRRYETVEKNIMFSSNSYFDSWLDMFEELIRIIMTNEDISFDGRATCGQLLRVKELNAFFMEKLALSDVEIEKIKAYVSYVNDHKHRNQKDISIDEIYNSLNMFNRIACSYAKLIQVSKMHEITIEHYANLLGSALRENAELKKENIELKRFLADYHFDNRILSDDDINKLSIEEQNKVLRRQVSLLKDIKITTFEEKLDKANNLLYEIKNNLLINNVTSYYVANRIDGSFKEELADARQKLKDNNKDE